MLCTKDPEEFDVRQGGDDSGFIDAAPGHGKALLTELLFGRGEDGPTVLANDPVAPPRVRMFHKPGRDPTRRSHVAERAGDCSACRHLPLRNFSEAFRNRICGRGGGCGPRIARPTDSFRQTQRLAHRIVYPPCIPPFELFRVP